MSENKPAAFTINEFLSWARIGRSKAYQEISSGRLKVRKIGRKTLVLRTDAEDWLNSLPIPSDIKTMAVD